MRFRSRHREDVLRVTLVVCLVVAMAGCKKPDPALAEAKAAIERQKAEDNARQRTVEAVRRAVASNLLDPNAAQFRKVNAYPSEGRAQTVCGEINGKNSFGAYAGFHGFYYVINTREVAISSVPAGAIGEGAFGMASTFHCEMLDYYGSLAKAQKALAMADRTGKVPEPHEVNQTASCGERC